MGPDGGHYAGGKLRFRNPIRRAFTLPTILCGSFVGLGQQEQDKQRRERQESNSTERSDEDYQDDDYDYEDDEDGDNDDNDDYEGCRDLEQRGSHAAGGRLSDLAQHDFYSLTTDPPADGQRRRRRQVVINDGSCADGEGSRRAGRRARRSQPNSSCSSATIMHASRLGSPVDPYDCDGPRGADSLSRLSCLVTPIRRIGQGGLPAPATTGDQHRHAHSSQRGRALFSANNQHSSRLSGESCPHLATLPLPLLIMMNLARREHVQIGAAAVAVPKSGC